MSSELDLARVTSQIEEAHDWLQTQFKISAEKLPGLRAPFEKPRSKVVVGFEIPSLPYTIQNLLGKPESRYRIETKRKGKIVDLSIENLDEKTKGFKMAFFLNTEDSPYSFEFPDIEKDNSYLGYMLKSDKLLRVVLAEKILSAVAKHFT